MVSGLLLAAFALSAVGLTYESLWNDEAWTAWAVRSPYLRDVMERIQADVHPPLYFLTLGVMGRFTGDSELALRWPSALFGMLALASTYAVGKRLFDGQTASLAVILLGSTGFYVYYTREARMYTLLLAGSAVATLLYIRWLKRPSPMRAAAYSAAIALLLYTHYAGALVVASHALHAVWIQLAVQSKRPMKWRFLPLPYCLGLLIFSPWIPVFVNQMRSNPNGPLAIPVATNWATVAGLILILTGGRWGLMLAPFVLGNSIARLRQFGKSVLLVVIWLILTPVVLLALNAWFAPVYQVRYSIAILPAGALLIAYGLRHIGLLPIITQKYGVSRWVSRAICGGLVIWIVVTQIEGYNALWPPKPYWESTVRAMIEARQPLDVTIADLAAYSPTAYYDRQLGLRRGVGLDLSWRLHTPSEIQSLVKTVATSPSVWVALPVNTAKTWQVAAALDQIYGISYRSSLGNMVFYQFERQNEIDLQFQLGNVARINGTLEADTQLTARAGETLCIRVEFTTLQTTDDSYSIGLHLVDITGNISPAQWDEGFGTHRAGEHVEIRPCLTIPDTVNNGGYHLELSLYKWATVERVPVYEVSRDSPVGWGDVVMLQSVQIE